MAEIVFCCWIQFDWIRPLVSHLWDVAAGICVYSGQTQRRFRTAYSPDIGPE